MFLFVHKKLLGWAHDSMGQEVLVHLLTVRANHQYSPERAVIAGEIVSLVAVRRFDSEVFPLFPVEAESALLALAAAVDAAETGGADAEIEWPAEEGYLVGNNYYIVAYRERDDATPFALREGVRVCPGYIYPGGGDGWPRLLEEQKRAA